MGKLDDTIDSGRAIDSFVKELGDQFGRRDPETDALATAQLAERFFGKALAAARAALADASGASAHRDVLNLKGRGRHGRNRRVPDLGKRITRLFKELLPIWALLAGLDRGEETERVKAVIRNLETAWNEADGRQLLAGALEGAAAALEEERDLWTGTFVRRLLAEAEAEGRELFGGLAYPEEKFAAVEILLRRYVKYALPEPRMTVWKPLPGESPELPEVGQIRKPDRGGTLQ
ncbi:MAG: hypothetical protein LBQ79_07890 [Deltaproteobacteria bacterium]|jgi:hypothetical protein|nr:hypothetical protein [Deltaproteobacteria bacterium]